MTKKTHFVSLLLFRFVSNMKSITVTMVVSFELVPLKVTFGEKKQTEKGDVDHDV